MTARSGSSGRRVLNERYLDCRPGGAFPFLPSCCQHSRQRWSFSFYVPFLRGVLLLQHSRNFLMGLKALQAGSGASDLLASLYPDWKKPPRAAGRSSFGPYKLSAELLLGIIAWVFAVGCEQYSCQFIG